MTAVNLTSFAIANDRLTAIILLVTLLGGVLAIRTMEQTMDPGFTIRTCQIVTGFPGANPERVEALVTDQIEKAVQEVPEIDFVSSTSKTGISIVSVNIRNEFNDMRPIWDDVRRKVEAVARNLPEGVVSARSERRFWRRLRNHRGRDGRRIRLPRVEGRGAATAGCVAATRQRRPR